MLRPVAKSLEELKLLRRKLFFLFFSSLRKPKRGFFLLANEIHPQSLGSELEFRVTR